MKTKLFVIGMFVTIGFSCRKSNYNPAVIPPAQDSLLSWKVIGNIPDKYLSDIWFTSSLRGFIVADHLYQTMDGGKTWVIIPNTDSIKDFDHLFFVDDKNGFAQSSSQLAVTVDGGTTWTVKPLATSTGLNIFFTSAATGFYGDKTGGSLKKTIDSGNSWTSIAKNTTTPDLYYPYFFDSDTGYIVTGNGIFSSTTDGGKTWNSIMQNILYNGFSLEYNSYNQLFFVDQKKGFYANPDGVSETDDGGQSWKYSLNGTVDPVCFDNIIRFPDPNTGYYKGYTAIYKTSDGGQTWNISSRLGTESLTGMYFIDTHTGWACTDKGRILKIQ